MRGIFRFKFHKFSNFMKRINFNPGKITMHFKESLAIESCEMIAARQVSVEIIRNIWNNIDQEKWYQFRKRLRYTLLAKSLSPLQPANLPVGGGSSRARNCLPIMYQTCSIGFTGLHADQSICAIPSSCRNLSLTYDVRTDMIRRITSQQQN